MLGNLSQLDPLGLLFLQTCLIGGIYANERPCLKTKIKKDYWTTEERTNVWQPPHVNLHMYSWTGV